MHTLRYTETVCVQPNTARLTREIIGWTLDALIRLTDQSRLIAVSIPCTITNRPGLAKPGHALLTRKDSSNFEVSPGVYHVDLPRMSFMLAACPESLTGTAAA